MADPLFEEPRLADVYDLFDSPDRPDLDPYVAMADEFGARTIVDLGCGTGNLACRLASLGKEVIGVDPALASLAVARRKTCAERVNWIHGTADALVGLQADLITMTGNVAQVFLADEEWSSVLHACRAALRPGGRLVFEVRDPAKQAWRNWDRAQTYQEIDSPSGGRVASWTDLLDVRLPLVSFRHTFVFRGDGNVLTSDSTLRFRSKGDIMDALSAAGLSVEDIRDAPDRPGLEFVFIARRRESP
ncbi:Ubiquinone/menaquinone biosynthesis C-methylase UbiE [Paenibacillus sp. UNC496MF]|uniref:class I SAM-dependent methyltransferase n=1 Tax=Paenibacillus sp. UNC496MF TaxID=1502753 RepID=UPI0008EADCFC|nr:class I SAM-dependent methyltransferase [Paenibacillus sp. UNC496MF]SFI41770.1 Ubiquinone/menaquinone biosynthesis C-methylase UbiE [Paenibacillus sp. UNC496MF]